MQQQHDVACAKRFDKLFILKNFHGVPSRNTYPYSLRLQIGKVSRFIYDRAWTYVVSATIYGTGYGTGGHADVIPVSGHGPLYRRSRSVERFSWWVSGRNAGAAQ